jgi:OmpA-OmpF porin, OOP family
MNSLHAPRLAALTGSMAGLFFAAGALGLLVSLPAQAQDGSHYYFGLSAGQGRYKFDEASIAARALNPGISATVLETDERANAYKAFLGWQWNRYLGAEVGYFDLGRSSFGASTVPAGRLDANMRVRGYNLDLVGTLPLGDTFALLARGGVALARTRGRFVGSDGATVVTPSRSERHTNPKYGIGLQVAFSPSVLMRIEAERYRVSDSLGQRSRVNAYSASLVFPFGRAAPPTRQAEVTPLFVPAAYTPPPPPVAVAQAPAMPEPVAPRIVEPPPPARVVLPVDSMFSHDSRELRPEAKSALDEFASRLAGRRYELILVAGHADRMGEDAHNQQLSQQRADVVKAYLGTLNGIEVGRIQANGRGSSEPVTAAADCDSTLARDALIVCLRPDRRVEVELTGQL